MEYRFSYTDLSGGSVMVSTRDYSEAKRQYDNVTTKYLCKFLLHFGDNGWQVIEQSLPVYGRAA